jgi:hypothetical protein
MRRTHMWLRSAFFNDDYWTQMQDNNPNDLDARDIPV